MHVATALELGDDLAGMITYDDRMADAARAHVTTCLRMFGPRRLLPLLMPRLRAGDGQITLSYDARDNRPDVTLSEKRACPHCGIGLHDHCGHCQARKSAFARFCHACGTPARTASAAAAPLEMLMARGMSLSPICGSRGLMRTRAPRRATSSEKWRTVGMASPAPHSSTHSGPSTCARNSERRASCWLVRESSQAASPNIRMLGRARPPQRGQAGRGGAARSRFSGGIEKTAERKIAGTALRQFARALQRVVTGNTDNRMRTEVGACAGDIHIVFAKMHASSTDRCGECDIIIND